MTMDRGFESYRETNFSSLLSIVWAEERIKVGRI